MQLTPGGEANPGTRNSSVLKTSVMNPVRRIPQLWSEKRAIWQSRKVTLIYSVTNYKIAFVMQNLSRIPKKRWRIKFLLILLAKTYGCISLSALKLRQAIQEEIENDRKWKNADLKQCIVKFFNRVVSWLAEKLYLPYRVPVCCSSLNAISVCNNGPM